MTDYLNFNDLKSLIIGIIGGFLVLAIHRYWSNRAIKAVARRLKETEVYKAKLDNLAKSDRALIIYGFQAVMLLTAFISVICALQTLLFLKPPGEMVDVRELVQVLLWLLLAVISIGIFLGFQRVADYPKSAQKLEERIEKLRNKLRGKSV